MRKSRLKKHSFFAHLFHPGKSNKNRARLLHPEIVFALALGVLGVFVALRIFIFSPGAYFSILGFSSSINAGEVIDQTNQERNKLGLPPLVMNDRLNQAALAKAQDMFTEQYWAHTSPSKREPWDFIREAGYVYKVAGENLARDFMTTSEMTAAWMNSPTHKANIVNSSFTEIGVAVVDGKLLGVETTLVVQMFGAQSAVKPAINKEAVTEKKIQPKPEVIESPITVDTQPEPVDSIAVAEPKTEFAQAEIQDKDVLSSTVEILSSFKPSPSLVNPLVVTKVLFLGVLLLVIFTLSYDGIISHHKKLERLVGKNFAHIVLLSTVAYLLLIFRGGVIQ